MNSPGVTHGSSCFQSLYRRSSNSESFGNFAACLNWSSNCGDTAPSPYTPRLTCFTSLPFIRESCILTLATGSPISVAISVGPDGADKENLHDAELGRLLDSLLSMAIPVM